MEGPRGQGPPKSMGIFFEQNMFVSKRGCAPEPATEPDSVQDGTRSPMGASWNVLGASWGVFGVLRASLGRLEGVLGASWGRLEGVLERLGAFWGRLGGVLGRRAVPFLIWKGL